MRTTLTIDDDVLAPAKAIAQQQGRSTTFDRRLSTKAVTGGKAALHLIASR